MRAEGVATIKTYSFSASHCKNNTPYKSASILTQSSTIMGEKKVLYQRSYKELFKQLSPQVVPSILSVCAYGNRRFYNPKLYLITLNRLSGEKKCFDDEYFKQTNEKERGRFKRDQFKKRKKKFKIASHLVICPQSNTSGTLTKTVKLHSNKAPPRKKTSSYPSSSVTAIGKMI